MLGNLERHSHNSSRKDLTWHLTTRFRARVTSSRETSKEKIGEATDSQDLKNEGSSDKAKGKLGQVVEGLKDDVKEATSNLNDKISEVADKNK